MVSITMGFQLYKALAHWTAARRFLGSEEVLDLDISSSSEVPLDPLEPDSEDTWLPIRGKISRT
jgi:hypothetical protein